MGELIVLKGVTAGAGRSVTPMRQPDYASDVIGGAGRPASQCERLGDVVERVLEGLTIRRTDISFTKS